MSRIRGGPLVRRLEILKLLQGNPMRTADIGDYYRSEDAETVDPRTIQRDLRALQDGFEFLGTTLKIAEETRGHSLKYYKSTIHPLFLALNLTELTALLKALQWGCRDSDQQVRETYRHLLNYVYRQLTDYAKGRLQHVLDVEIPKEPAQNRPEEDIYRTNILYLLKSGRKVKITYTTEKGDRVTRLGRVRNYKEGIITFRDLEEGSTLSRHSSEIFIDWDEIDYM